MSELAWDGSKRYLGDAVYVEMESHLLKMTVEYESGRVLETIYLDESVLANLFELVMCEEVKQLIEHRVEQLEIEGSTDAS